MVGGATMLRLVFVLSVAGITLAITENPTPSSTHVMVRMELDNNVKQVNASLATLKKNIAKELCNVPETDVTVLQVMNDNTKVLGVGNTQTLLYAACKAPVNKLEAVRDDCEDWLNRHEVKDETKDKTSWWNGGEVEVDDIDCKYVENGKFEYFSKTDANKAASSGTTPTATTAANSGAAGAASAVVTAAAAGAALLLLV